MSTDPTTPPQPATSPVAGLLARVAAERGLDFEPAPAAVIDALPGLAAAAEEVAARCRDAQERRWLAAALAALSHQIQARALAELTELDPC